MDVAAVIATLRAHRPELEAMGIAHAGVFGSVARGEAGPGSDIDILVEFAPGQPGDIYAYVGVQEQVASLFPGRVDVVDRGSLRPRLRGHVLADLIHAF
ncbi:nucleotidyltransferase family protein [Paracraurococcus lichenis]|uniref:Nucleotidyltransferase family protein n=1 Tax=Paracraurococcus lichenis TaxID=3064888 RepID=A0ABT9DV53_9PROT|nr:nucleotidyltransferase family protein [Paracraurococcus sp. LOR1-02]MDO9707777.1 nucleotidyltransferase family protein [Paracraurococcus sp. LOR1-02]